jgi:hypothetical protein
MARARFSRLFLLIATLQAMQQLSQCLDPKMLAQFGGKKG